MTDTNMNSSPFNLEDTRLLNDELITSIGIGGGAEAEDDNTTEALFPHPPPIFEIATLHSTEIDDTQGESLDAPELLSPHQYEQNARELLIERERQSRLERDRARLKRHLALSRDRHEEELQQVNDGLNHETNEYGRVLSQDTNDHGSNHLDILRDDKSAICTVGDASEIVSTHPSHDGRTLDHTYKYVMERFISENLGIMERSNHPRETMNENETNPSLQQRAAHFRNDFLTIPHNPLSSTYHTLLDDGADIDFHSTQIQRMSQDENDVTVSDHDHDSLSHSNLVGSDDNDDVNNDDDNDVIQSDLDDGFSYNHSQLGNHSDVYDYTSSIGNISTQGENNLPFQSFSTFDFRPISNNFSEGGGTHTTVQESTSASSVHGYSLTTIHPSSFSLLDHQGNYQNTNVEALEESISVASITSVVANLSVHSDESNTSISIPISRRNIHGSMMQSPVERDSLDNRSQVHAIDRSILGSRNGGNHFPLDDVSVDSYHSSLGLGKHPLSESSEEYDKINTRRNLRISAGSSTMNESYASKRYGLVENGDLVCSAKISRKVPSTIFSHQTKKKLSDNLIDSGFGSRIINCHDVDGENSLPIRHQLLDEKRFTKDSPERLRQLITTIITEIPVFVIIKSGSSNLSRVVGQTKFHLIMSILPMSLAISRIYASDIVKSKSNATSTLHETTNECIAFIAAEWRMLVCSSLSIGILLGSIIYSLTFDIHLGITIALSVTLQMLASAMLVFLSPLLFPKQRFYAIFIYAIQDIIGSFTMIHFCYRLFLLFKCEDTFLDT